MAWLSKTFVMVAWRQTPGDNMLERHHRSNIVVCDMSSKLYRTKAVVVWVGEGPRRTRIVAIGYTDRKRMLELCSIRS